jgi:hypothetical protein
MTKPEPFDLVDADKFPYPYTQEERLAHAVLLFHRGGPWTSEDQSTWLSLTGEPEVTTKSLCDFARKSLEL